MSGTITPTTPNQLQAPTNDRIPNRTLGQGDFMNLLITQLANQNPLKPTDGNEMLAQMTQISSIQSMSAMQTAMTKMQTQQQLNTAQNMIGKRVQVYDVNTSKDIVGTVDAASVVSDKNADGSRTQSVTINIGGVEYPIESLVSVLKDLPAQN